MSPALLIAGENHLEVALRGSGHRRRPTIGGAGRATARVRPPLQRHPQDGRRLRLGLGAGSGRRRHLEVGRHRVLERGPAGDGPAAGSRRRCLRRLETHVELEWAADAEPVQVAVTAAARPSRPPPSPDSPRSVLELTVPDVELWWPRGYGAQTRYDVTVEVAGQRHRRAGRLPHRRAATSRPTRTGTRYVIKVNGDPIYVKGDNWIPDDAFAHQARRPTRTGARSPRPSTPDEPAADLGRRIYESDDFYDVCDELGVLVWQDFLFACAAYAEEEPLRSEVVAEAREAVARLSPQPSLVLWNGNNENIWGYVEWGWRPQLGDAPGATATTARSCRRSSPSWIPGRRTPPGAPTPTRSTTTPTTSAAAPCTSGTCGTRSTTPTTATTRPVRLRVRVPGSGGLVDAVLGRP